MTAGTLEDKWFGKPIKQHVREFGCLFGVIFLAIVSYLLWFKGYSLLDLVSIVFLTLGFGFAFLGIRHPAVLHPLWKGWMWIAEKISVVMTFVLMCISWTILVTPLSFLLRALGKKVMDCTYDPAKPSYWETKDEKKCSFQLLERQF